MSARPPITRVWSTRAGKVVFSQKLPNAQVEIEQLITRVAKVSADVVWAVDITSGVAGLC